MSRVGFFDETSSNSRFVKQRVLRRPVGGWSARIWRREAVNGLLFGLVVTGSWAALNIAVKLIDVVAL